MEHESVGDTNSYWRVRYSYLSIGTRTGGIEIQRTSGDRPNYRIVDIGQNAEKSPGDLGILIVTQTPVKNHQLKLMGKSLK